jgi:hypothetical protein
MEGDTMAAWDYRTVRIVYDAKRKKNWVLQGNDEALVGMQVILDAYGAEGWELVALAPDAFEVTPGFGKWYQDPTAYRATFKRPVEG